MWANGRVSFAFSGTIYLSDDAGIPGAQVSFDLTCGARGIKTQLGT